MMVILPFYILYYMIRKRNRQVTEVEKAELSALYENMNHKYLLQNLFYFFFFLRRLSMVFLILFFYDNPQLQMGFFTYTSLF